MGIWIDLASGNRGNRSNRCIHPSASRLMDLYLPKVNAHITLKSGMVYIWRGRPIERESTGRGVSIQYTVDANTLKHKTRKGRC